MSLSPFIHFYPGSTGSSSNANLSLRARTAIAFSIPILAVLLFLGLVIVGVLIYGYRRPHSKVGMFMIEVRLVCFFGGGGGVGIFH